MSVLSDLIKNLSSDGLESMGRFYSIYRAFVADNDDPEEMGRLSLIIPGIVDEEVGYWSWPLGMFAGKDYGSKVIPPIGSTVYCMFEMGDPSKPVWLHGFYGENEMPEEYRDPNNFYFVSPGGAVVSINDTDQTIFVSDHQNNEFHLNERGVSVVVDGDKKIFLGSKDKADEPAVLGDTLQKLLEKVIDNQVEINKQISQLSDLTVSTFRRIGLSPGIVTGGQVMASATTMAAQALSLKGRISASNESIMATYKRFKQFKSQTVKLDK